jgi:hypothetical protein
MSDDGHKLPVLPLKDPRLVVFCRSHVFNQCG